MCGGDGELVMAGISTKRCDQCGEVALVSDHGRIKTVGETRFVEGRPNGSTAYRCVCGELVVWQRETAKAGK